jgi:hypothetical protein
MRETLRAFFYAVRWTLPVAVTLGLRAPAAVCVLVGLAVGFVLRGNWYGKDVRVAEQRGRDQAHGTLQPERSRSVLPDQAPASGRAVGGTSPHRGTYRHPSYPEVTT